MSDSMYAIGWLEMKEFDRAYADFKKMFRHIAGDFQVNDDYVLSLFWSSVNKYREECVVSYHTLDIWMG